MTTQKKKRKRDIEKNYPVKQFVKKLRRHKEKKKA